MDSWWLSCLGLRLFILWNWILVSSCNGSWNDYGLVEARLNGVCCSWSECVPSECLCGFHCYRFVVFGVELIMRGFHGCCLWALGLLLWWVSEGALDMLAFVCECWFMIWLLLSVLSFKMIITARMIRKRFCWCLFVRIRSGWANYIRFLSVWWMCCLLMDFIGFMFSMNAVVVWVHDAGFLGLFIMNVMWQSFCDCCEQCGILCVFMGL